MKNGLIEIKGTQTVDGNSENIEMTTVGKMYIKDGLWRLIYRENSDDLAASSVTTLAVDAFGAVSLDRSGSADSHMTVQKGKRHMSLYTMGPCEFTLGTFGEKVENEIGENGGRLSMRYTVDINSTYASTNEIKIKVQEI